MDYLSRIVFKTEKSETASEKVNREQSFIIKWAQHSNSLSGTSSIFVAFYQILAAKFRTSDKWTGLLKSRIWNVKVLMILFRCTFWLQYGWFSWYWKSVSTKLALAFFMRKGEVIESSLIIRNACQRLENTTSQTFHFRITSSKSCVKLLMLKDDASINLLLSTYENRICLFMNCKRDSQ